MSGFCYAKELSIVPYSPKRPCAYIGCPRLAVNGQYCAVHQKEMERHYNHFQRDLECNKRYGRAWKRIRDRFIKAHPLCEECRKQGRLTPAAEVHHILPLSDGGTHDYDNLMALCKACHSRITLEANKQNRSK